MDTQPTFRGDLITAFLNQQKAQDPTQTSVCRCLFGPGDHDLNKRVAREHMKQHSRIMQERYNFNFGTETPVNGGKFAWESEASEHVPFVYRTLNLLDTRRSISQLNTRKDTGDIRQVAQAQIHSEKQPLYANPEARVHSSQGDASLPGSVQTVSVSPSVETVTSESSSVAASTSRSGTKRKQFITDYYSVKKRRSEAKID